MNQAAILPIRQNTQQNEDPSAALNQNRQQQDEQDQYDQQLMQQELLARIIKCNRFLRGMQLCQIFIVSVHLVLVSALVLVFSCIDTLKHPYHHASIITFSIFVLSFHFCSYCFLKFNGKFLEDDSKQKSWKQQIKSYLCMMVVISFAGAFLLGKIVYDVVKLNNMTSQSHDIDYDKIIISFDYIFSIVGLEIIAIVFLVFLLGLMIFYSMLTFIHLILWVFSRRRISLLKKFQSHFYNKLNVFHPQRLKKLQKFQKIIDYNKQQDKISFESQTCSICLECFQDKQKIYELPCMGQSKKHNFHMACLKTWVIKSSNCPYCRSSFISLKKK